MRTGLLLLAVGCNFAASTKMDGFDSAANSGAGADEEPEEDTAEEEEDEPDPLDVDDDDDGYTENQGDCNDEDDDVFPGAEDVCDGTDNDCDDEVDEDALDAYEPNDDTRAPLGTVGDDPLIVEASLHSEDDVDLFQYTIDDGWIDLVLGIRVVLSGFTSDIAYKLVVTEISSGMKQETFKEVGADELVLEFDDSIFGSESGDYEVRISTMSGHGCEHPYTLTVSENSFLPW